MSVQIANWEDPGQTASSDAVILENILDPDVMR